MISISNNDNPYELQIDTIDQYTTIYLNIFGIVNVDYFILQISNPITICGNSSK